MKLSFERKHWILFSLLVSLSAVGVILTALKSQVHIGPGRLLLIVAYSIAVPFATTILLIDLVEKVFAKDPHNRK